MNDLSDRPAAFNADAVSSLTGHADDPAFALEFVSRFRRLLPERISRIDQTLAGHDPKAMMDAVLSLKVSSCTLGADELCAVSTRIEESLRRSDVAGARRAAGDLAEARARADQELGSFLA